MRPAPLQPVVDGDSLAEMCTRSGRNFCSMSATSHSPAVTRNRPGVTARRRGPLVRRSSVAALASIVIVLLATSCSSPSNADRNAAGDASLSYLFVVDGDDATMEPVAGSPDTYDFTVDLACVQIDDCDPIVWFADRPTRDAGSIDVPHFVALWSEANVDGFATKPPNVAIELPATTTGSARPSTIVATMSDPFLVRDTTRNDSILLRARMRIVPQDELSRFDDDGSKLATHATRVLTTIPVKLGDVTVFVDPEIGMSVADLYGGASGHNASGFGTGGNGGNGVTGVLPSGTTLKVGQTFCC